MDFPLDCDFSISLLSFAAATPFKNIPESRNRRGGIGEMRKSYSMGKNPYQWKYCVSGNVNINSSHLVQ